MNSEKSPPSEVAFQVIYLNTPQQECQALAINLLKPESLIGAHELQSPQLPDELDLQREVILYGRAPNWLLAHLAYRLRESPWVGYYDIRTQNVVVVYSQVSQPQVGDAIPVIFNTIPGIAILVGGPPNSGKSVFSNALRVALSKKRPDKKVYLHRANWDGEGNHTYETRNSQLAEQLRKENNRKLHKSLDDESLEKYFLDRAKETANIRNITDLVLVDVGGVPDPRKAPILEQCSYYIIISKDADQIDVWHSFCNQPLKPLAVIHSVLDQKLEVLRTRPYLEVIAGPWLRDRPCSIPDILLSTMLEGVGEYD